MSLCVDVGLGATLTPYAVSVPRAVACGEDTTDYASWGGFQPLRGVAYAPLRVAMPTVRFPLGTVWDFRCCGNPELQFR